MLADERLNVGIGGRVGGLQGIGQPAGHITGQYRYRSSAQPLILAAVRVDAGGGDDHAIESADLTPTAGQLAEAVAETSTIRHQKDVMALAGDLGPARLVRRPVLLDSLPDSTVQPLGLVHIEDHRARPAGMQEHAVIDAGEPGGDNRGVAAGLALPVVTED